MGTKKVRHIMKIFGGTAGSGEFGKIGSDAAGLPATTKDLTLIQSLVQYFQGYFGITVVQGASKLPRSEDLNSLFYLTTAQLSYLMEAGVPEWLDSADQEYFEGQGFVSLNGSLYVCIKGDGAGDVNVQKNPETNPLWWKIIYTKDPVSAYDVAEAVAYESAGVLVESFGKHYSSTGLSGNAGKNPSDPVNAGYWYKAKDDLEDYAMTATPLPGSFHVITDRAHAQYNQNILLDKKFKGSQEYNLDAIMLDGTVITGDAHLEDDILKIGTADEYPFLDKIATFNLAVWTLKDVGGQAQRAQTVGDDFDVMGSFVENQFQGHKHTVQGWSTNSQAGAGGRNASGTGYVAAPLVAMDNLFIQEPTTDTINGTPRIGTKTYGDTEVMGITPMVIMSKA